MWDLDHKEGWVLKNWYFGIVVLEKNFESLLYWKEIKLVNPKGNQPWIFIGRTDAEVEAPKLWSPDEKSQLIGKDPDAGKDWRQKQKGTADDEIGSITNSINISLSKLQELVKDRKAWRAAVQRVRRFKYDLVIEQQQHS